MYRLFVAYMFFKKKKTCEMPRNQLADFCLLQVAIEYDTRMSSLKDGPSCVQRSSSVAKRRTKDECKYTGAIILN